MYAEANKFKYGLKNSDLEKMGVRLLPLDLEKPARNEPLFYTSFPENYEHSYRFDRQFSGGGRSLLNCIDNLSGPMGLLGEGHLAKWAIP